jgi:hypothetical protein
MLDYTTKLNALKRKVRKDSERIAILESQMIAVKGTLQSAQREKNGLLDFLGRGTERIPSRRSSASKKEFSYYIAFTDVDDNTRDFTVSATSKTDALAKAKSYLREDNENLKGAQFYVERED